MLHLLFIILFSLVLRLYLIDSMPLGVRNDEASFGYNAYSILQTGKDEHGEFFPLIFTAFGDQKLPVYMYSIVPMIKVFGLNNFAVRLPSALAGTFGAVVMYLILLNIVYLRRYALLGALILAASPWSIIMSRSAFESNVALFFFMLGMYFYVKYERLSSLKHATLSALFFGLTWYTYISYRLIIPIFFVVLYFLRRFVQRQTEHRSFFYLIIVFLIVVTPLLPTLFSHQGTARLEQIGIFSDDGVAMEINEARTFCLDHFSRPLCYGLSNKPLVYTRQMLFDFVRTLSPEYLFISGDTNTRYLDVDNFGNFHVYLLPFYVLGIVYLGRKCVTRTIGNFESLVLTGFIISPLPGMLTHGPQMIRISSLLPFLVIMTCYGIAYSAEYFKTRILRKVYITAHTFLAVIFGCIFCWSYIGISVPKNDVFYQTHIVKLMEYLRTVDPQTQVYIHQLPEAITYYAYVNAVDPGFYQKEIVYPSSDIFGFAHATDLNNIHQTSKNYDEILCTTSDHEVLFVAHENIDDAIKPLKIIHSSSGVHHMYFIYDLFLFPQPNCEEFKEN